MEEQELKENAAKMIVEAVDFASMAGLTASDCGISLSTSLYLNIRDAMFHFKALCDSTDPDNRLRHYFNLKEHLLRGEKDAIICQVHSLCDAIHEIMQQKDFHKIFKQEETKQLQVLVHDMKDVVLRLRIEGADLHSDVSFSVLEAWQAVKVYTDQVVRLCRSKNILLF